MREPFRRPLSVAGRIPRPHELSASWKSCGSFTISLSVGVAKNKEKRTRQACGPSMGSKMGQIYAIELQVPSRQSLVVLEHVNLNLNQLRGESKWHLTWIATAEGVLHACMNPTNVLGSQNDSPLNLLFQSSSVLRAPSFPRSGGIDPVQTAKPKGIEIFSETNGLSEFKLRFELCRAPHPRVGF